MKSHVPADVVCSPTHGIELASAPNLGRFAASSYSGAALFGSAGPDAPGAALSKSEERDDKGSVALSIRELVRQAYLYSAGILVRPLVERAGMIRYLQCNPDAVQLWQSGWPRNRQPALQELLNVLYPGWQLSDHEVIRELMNKLVHSDPAGSTYNMLQRSDGTLVFSSGKIIDAPHFCAAVCAAGICYLKNLTSTALDIFFSDET